MGLGWNEHSKKVLGLSGEPVHDCCRSLVLVLLVSLRRDCIQGCGVDRVGCHGKQPLGFDEGIENLDRIEALAPHGMRELKVHCMKVHKIMPD